MEWTEFSDESSLRKIARLNEELEEEAKLDASFNVLGSIINFSNVANNSRNISEVEQYAQNVKEELKKANNILPSDMVLDLGLIFRHAYHLYEELKEAKAYE